MVIAVLENKFVTTVIKNRIDNYKKQTGELIYEHRL